MIAAGPERRLGLHVDELALVELDHVVAPAGERDGGVVAAGDEAPHVLLHPERQELHAGVLAAPHARRRHRGRDQIGAARPGELRREPGAAATAVDGDRRGALDLRARELDVVGERHRVAIVGTDDEHLESIERDGHRVGPGLLVERGDRAAADRRRIRVRERDRDVGAILRRDDREVLRVVAGDRAIVVADDVVALAERGPRQHDAAVRGDRGDRRHELIDLQRPVALDHVAVGGDAGGIELVRVVDDEHVVIAGLHDRAVDLPVVVRERDGGDLGRHVADREAGVAGGPGALRERQRIELAADAGEDLGGLVAGRRELGRVGIPSSPGGRSNTGASSLAVSSAPPVLAAVPPVVP